MDQVVVKKDERDREGVKGRTAGVSEGTEAGRAQWEFWEIQRSYLMPVRSMMEREHVENESMSLRTCVAYR